MPIRVRWDVDIRGRVGRPKRIARQIRGIAPLFVELRIEGERGLSELSAIFAEIHKCNPRVAVTIGLFPKAPAALRWGYPIDFVWEIDGRRKFRNCLPDGAKAVSFTPDEDTISFLPDILEEFAASPAAHMHLPNINAVRAIALKGHIPVPRPDQMRQASEAISRSGLSLPGKRLVVHDYFLWKILRDVCPGEVGDRLEFSGCQAGTALAHVDWEGNVYPCDSLPIRLGNLLETPFERIWAAEARQRVAEAIKATPGDCEKCGVYSGCFGGCRGLGYLSSESFDTKDPSCPVEPAPAEEKRS
jgi:GeoRSP system SPASM domain protein